MVTMTAATHPSPLRRIRAITDCGPYLNPVINRLAAGAVPVGWRVTVPDRRSRRDGVFRYATLVTGGDSGMGSTEVLRANSFRGSIGVEEIVSLRANALHGTGCVNVVDDRLDVQEAVAFWRIRANSPDRSMFWMVTTFFRRSQNSQDGLLLEQLLLSTDLMARTDRPDLDALAHRALTTFIEHAL